MRCLRLLHARVLGTARLAAQSVKRLTGEQVLSAATLNQVSDDT